MEEILRDIGIAVRIILKYILTISIYKWNYFIHHYRDAVESYSYQHTIFSNRLFHIIFSFYIWLQNEVLSGKFTTKVLKSHSFFPMFFNFCPLLSAFTKLRKVSSCLSVIPPICPHGTTRLLLNGFSCNLMFGHFPKSVDNIQVSVVATEVVNPPMPRLCSAFRAAVRSPLLPTLTGTNNARSQCSYLFSS